MEKKQHVFSHDYGNGLKLMEHSYIGNNFVNIVEQLISENGDWFGDRIIWAGDYADGEPELFDEDGREINWYQIVSENKINPKPKNQEYQYVINLDTKEFVDKKKVPVTDVWDDEEIRIHPLPLLTCEGNGRGGGDYRGGDVNLIGKWSRQRITVSNTIPDGFSELIFDVVY